MYALKLASKATFRASELESAAVTTAARARYKLEIHRVTRQQACAKLRCVLCEAYLLCPIIEAINQYSPQPPQSYHVKAVFAATQARSAARLVTTVERSRGVFLTGTAPFMSLEGMTKPSSLPTIQL